MTWTFHLRATEDPRLFSRVLQILVSQMVSIHSFQGEVNNGEISVAFVVSSEEDKAYRIEALLEQLHHVHHVSVLSK